MLKRLQSRQIRLIPFILIIVSLACSLPFVTQETPLAPTPTTARGEAATAIPPAPPTPTPQPLPPSLVESVPPAGSEISLKEPVTLYFNQAMERASVESAFSGPPGQLSWIDDSTVTYLPSSPLAPHDLLKLSLAASARAANGLPLSNPVNLAYQTAGFLRLVQSLPEADAKEVDPTSAVVASFNYPIVPLGAEADSFPQAFNLVPEVSGQGEWLNSSTYIFYPSPTMAGGKTYTARLNPDLTSTAGSQLENALSWSFTTAFPRLEAFQPEDGQGDVRLDSPVILTFNQPMNADSVASNFALLDTNSDQVAGEFSWNEDFTQLTFTPRRLFKRAALYTVTLEGSAQTGGGTQLGPNFQSSFRTVPSLRVLGSEPLPGGSRRIYQSVVVYFDAPIQSRDVLQFITFNPEVPNLQAYTDDDGRTLRLNANFTPSTDYSLIISPNLPDAWNGRLGKEFTLQFRTQPLDAELVVNLGSDVLFLTPEDSSLTVQAANLPEVSITLGSLPMEDFMSMYLPGGYEIRQSYQPEDQRTFRRSLDLPADRMQAVNIPISLGSGSLEPGLYYLKFNPTGEQYIPGPFLLVVSNIQVTFKLGATDALVWAVDLRDGTALAGAPVTIFAENGTLLTSGQTDTDGIFKASIPTLEEPYSTTFAVFGEPGQDQFALALSTWNQGIEGWNLGVRTNYSPPRLTAYLYTDRPIYRPGQTVYFRAVVRQAHNGRYSLPDRDNLPVALSNDFGEEIETFELPISSFGTAHGAYTLPPDSAPGLYRLSSEEASFSSVAFQVAEYRKPEINLQLAFTAEQYLAGDPLNVKVEARYFFDAPAGNVPVKWSLYRTPATFYLPGYQVGVIDTGWLEPFPRGFPGVFDELVSEGQSETDSRGLLQLEFTTSLAEATKAGRQRYTLEITAEDESGLPVSARASALVDPAAYFIGIRPDAWVGQADRETGYEVLVVNADSDPAGERSLRAVFQKVTWQRIDPKPGDLYSYPTFVPRYTPIGSADFTTGTDGVARLAFTPPEPGVYQLEVGGLQAGEAGARSQALIWVGGPGQAVWPNLPNQRLRITADRQNYLPGDTARIFIPNPFPEGALALVTVERGVVFSHQVLELTGSGENLALELGEQDAPNVYVSVTLLKVPTDGSPDFRHGYLNLPVEPVVQTLQVTLTSEPQRTGPGEQVTFGVRVSDSQGNPAVGEFSISVVDLAVLALAKPNSPDILAAFYSMQPLGVRTGLALAVYTQRLANLPDGLGGGGAPDILAPLMVREQFPDTALWNAEIVTDENGEAVVTANLPDSLTTWQVDLRGVTADTRVGQAETQVVTSKDLIIRPVTPRFLVAGDHALLAAVIQNNTDQAVQGEVTLQASGFELDSASPSVLPVAVPAGGRSRVEWWGTAQDVEAADLVFAVRAGELEDAARPTLGALPVLRYTAPQTFGTAGTLDEGGEQLELVSLPRSFEARGGQLSVELAPSLSAAMVNALQVLENYPYDCTEQVLSRFLPNLETLRVLQEFSLEAPALQERLERTLDEGLTQLLARQNEDGGWGWWRGQPSDAYISAYVLFGLSRARQAGVAIDPSAIRKASDYLYAVLPTPQMLNETWQYDRLAFQQYALAVAGAGDLSGTAALYTERAKLNPWSQALLALALESLSPSDERTQTLLSDLGSSARRSAAGAHWEDHQPSWQNMSTPVYATAVTLYALAQHDPASPLVADGMRYLMAHRSPSGGWASTYESAWTLMALAQVMRGTGELGGDFDFSAALNRAPLLSGQAAGEAQLTPVNAAVSLSELYTRSPNALLIQRDAGPGRLYYSAYLRVDRAAEEAVPLERGISISRAHYPGGEQACLAEDCAPVLSARPGDLVNVRLTITVPETRYYLLVEDYIPAGAEILDVSLETSQQGAAPDYDPRRPFSHGWGWWHFSGPQVFDDHIAWAADVLPPGTYELTYTLVMLQPGEFRLLPARAWQFYFPDVQGSSAGEIFVIKP